MGKNTLKMYQCCIFYAWFCTLDLWIGHLNTHIVFLSECRWLSVVLFLNLSKISKELASIMLYTNICVKVYNHLWHNFCSSTFFLMQGYGCLWQVMWRKFHDPEHSITVTIPTPLFKSLSSLVAWSILLIICYGLFQN